MKRCAWLFALVPILASAAEPGSNVHLTPGPKLTRELTQSIKQADAKLFAAFFDHRLADEK